VHARELAEELVERAQEEMVDGMVEDEVVVYAW
jgi:hypothetical protein